MPRSAARILGALLVLGALGSGAASVAGAAPPRQAGVLLGEAAEVLVAACGGAPAGGDVTAVVPAGRFDAGTRVRIAGLDTPGIEVVPVHARPGEAVVVRLVVDPGVAADRAVVELRASGTSAGLPAEVIDRLAVEVACPA